MHVQLLDFRCRQAYSVLIDVLFATWAIKLSWKFWWSATCALDSRRACFSSRLISMRDCSFRVHENYEVTFLRGKRETIFDWLLLPCCAFYFDFRFVHGHNLLTSGFLFQDTYLTSHCGWKGYSTREARFALNDWIDRFDRTYRLWRKRTPSFESEPPKTPISCI